MNTTSNADAGKNILWPGATPYFGASIAPNPFGLRGSLPATVCSPRGRTSTFLRPHSCQFSSEQTAAAHMRNPGPTKEDPCLY